MVYRFDCFLMKNTKKFKKNVKNRPSVSGRYYKVFLFSRGKSVGFFLSKIVRTFFFYSFVFFFSINCFDIDILANKKRVTTHKSRNVFLREKNIYLLKKKNNLVF